MLGSGGRKCHPKESQVEKVPNGEQEEAPGCTLLTRDRLRYTHSNRPDDDRENEEWDERWSLL